MHICTNNSLFYSKHIEGVADAVLIRGKEMVFSDFPSFQANILLLFNSIL